MKFEEQFPSLKHLELHKGLSDIESVIVYDVLKHCLDKQRVKEAIKKYFVHGYVGDGTIHSSACRMCKVLKELGLDK